MLDILFARYYIIGYSWGL